MPYDNDNGGGGGSGPDRHTGEVQGQAALLVAESLLHMLVERGILSGDDVIELLGWACETKMEIAVQGAERREIAEASIRYLDAIRASFARG